MLLATKILRVFIIARHVTSCVATKLPEEFRDRLHSVMAPLIFVRSIPSCQITSLLISHVYKTLCFSFEAFRAVKFLQQTAVTSKGLLFLKNTLWKKSFLNATVCVKFE